MIRVFSPVSHKTVRITDASESAVALAVNDAVGDGEFDAAGQHPADAINLQWQSSRRKISKDVLSGLNDSGECRSAGGGMGGSSPGGDDYVSFIFFMVMHLRFIYNMFNSTPSIFIVILVNTPFISNLLQTVHENQVCVCYL
jgi:hypothetical protein